MLMWQSVKAYWEFFLIPLWWYDMIIINYISIKFFLKIDVKKIYS